jgi:thiol-disulfide isomerase/thioredoxin
MMKRLVLTAALGLMACVAAADTAKVPRLAVTTVDGKTFDLAQQKGKWVIVNFWATWCSPCVKEMPDISAFVAKTKEVSAIGLAYEDTEKAGIESFLKTHPVVYPVAQVDVYDPPKDFDTPRGLPTTYLIAPDGSVAKRFTGPVTSTDLEKAIVEAKAKSAPQAAGR